MPSRKTSPPLPAQPMNWPRADPQALAAFDPRTKVCTMNCGPSTLDPRRSAERLLLCDDCLTIEPTGEPMDTTPTIGIEQLMLLVQQYASQLVDATLHQSASRADIAKTQALKTLREIRTALMALDPDKVAQQAGELERVKVRLAAAELLSETAQVDRLEEDLIRLHGQLAGKGAAC